MLLRSSPPPTFFPPFSHTWLLLSKFCFILPSLSLDVLVWGVCRLPAIPPLPPVEVPLCVLSDGRFGGFAELLGCRRAQG